MIEKRGVETRYWTPAVHLAAFALPRYAETVVWQAIFDGCNDRAAKNGRGKNKNDKKARA